MAEVAMWMAAMILFAAVGVFLVTFLRGRQRLAEIKAANALRLEGDREMQLLTEDNAGLSAHVGRLEDRIATLERIVTDPADRTAREIESLR